MNAELIGETAGQVWNFLKDNPNSSLSAVERVIDVPPWRVHMALGWLAREGKLRLTRKGRTLQHSLAEE
jgi:hypothetical protein